MNKLIIKLANEANKEVGYTFKLEDAKQIHELMEKFAELIVQECASIDFYKLAHIGTEDDYNVTQVIKQHFGVEE